MARTRLQPIDVEDLGVESAPSGTVTGFTVPGGSPGKVDPPPSPAVQSALAGLIALSLKALSQRALVALASLVDLALIGSVFVLWLNMMAEPSTLQLVGGGMYGTFILACLWARR